MNRLLFLSEVFIKTTSDNESGVDPSPRRGGRQPGRPNYQNNVLIGIVERILPNGNEGWKIVALAYKEESGEEILRSEDDLKKNWVRKLCNNMKKPTGRMGADVKDRINRCIAIERRILDKTSSGILGVSSEEDVNLLLLPSLSGDEESNEESKEEVVPGTEVQPHHIDFLQPPPLPPFSFANDNSTQPNEPTDDTIANDNTAKTSTDADVFANGQGANATQVAGRNTASSTVSRAGERSTTPISAAA